MSLENVTEALSDRLQRIFGAEAEGATSPDSLLTMARSVRDADKKEGRGASGDPFDKERWTGRCENPQGKNLEWKSGRRGLAGLGRDELEALRQEAKRWIRSDEPMSRVWQRTRAVSIPKKESRTRWPS